MPFYINDSNTDADTYKKRSKKGQLRKSKAKTKKQTKKNKIIDIPFSSMKSKGTRATLGNVYFHYQHYSNINNFFSILNKDLKNKINLNSQHLTIKARKTKLTLDNIPELECSASLNLLIIDLDTIEGKHANIAIINNINNTIEYYEPHGYRKNKNSEIADIKGIYNKKNKLLKNVFQELLPEHSFIDVVSMNKNTSFQTLLDPDENTGFCVTWCILFVHYRLLNPNILLSRLIKHIDKTINTTKLLKYAKYVEDTIKHKFDLK